jgi:hypothetical protein
MEESSLSERIVEYLSWTEKNEPDVWLRDDIRIALITVSFAAKGYPKPHVLASYQVLGLYPEQVAPAIEARRRAKLGSLYDQQFTALPPKKPSASVVGSDRQSKASGE